MQGDRTGKKNLNLKAEDTVCEFKEIKCIKHQNQKDDLNRMPGRNKEQGRQRSKDPRTFQADTVIRDFPVVGGGGVGPDVFEGQEGKWWGFQGRL